MTPTQQKTIIRLNDRGASAGEIAAELHITPDAVKKYLQRNTGALPVSVEETCKEVGDRTVDELDALDLEGSAGVLNDP